MKPNSSIPLGAGAAMAQPDRATHVQVIGRTGTGKSRLLRLMMKADLRLNAEQEGPGFALVDPAGDLFDYVLAEASNYPEIRKRLYLIDITDRSFWPGLNYLDAARNYSLTGRASMIVAAIQKAYGQDEERRVLMERMFDLVLPVFLLEQDYLSFAEMPAFIGNDPTLRRAILAKLQAEKRLDPGLLVEWRDFDRIKQPDKQKEQMGAVLNRVFRFAVGVEERRLFCQPSTINFRKIMDERGILLVKIPEAAGYPTALCDLIGCFVVDEIIAAARSRQEQTEAERRAYVVYLDEFARFVSNQDIQRALDELRKFRCSFVLAHQHLTQLREKNPALHASVKANCNVRICFGVSADDAEEMAREMFSEELAADQILDEITSQVITPVESTRTVKTHGQSQNESESESESESETETEGESYFESDSEAEADSEVDSYSESVSESYSTTRSETYGETETETESEMEAETESEGKSEMESESRSEAFSVAETTSEMDAQTEMESVSEMESSTVMDGAVEMSGGGAMTSASSTLQTGAGVTVTYAGDGGNGFIITPDPMATSQIESHSQSDSQMRGSSSTWSSGSTHAAGTSHGSGHTSGQARTHATGQGLSHGVTVGSSIGQGHGTSQAKGHTQASGRARSTGETRAAGTTEGAGEGYSEGESHAEGHTTTRGRSWGQGESRAHGYTHGQSRGTTRGHSESESFSEVPFIEQCVSREVSSRQYRSQDNKLARIVHRLISLLPRHAYIQIGRSCPIPFVTADTEEPDATRAALSRARRWALENNQSGRPLQVIEQIHRERQEKIRGVIEEYREREELPPAGVVEAEFEVVEGDPQAGVRSKPARTKVPIVEKNPHE